MINNYYVYFLINPLTNIVFYVGKGKNERCFQHLKENDINTENKYKLAIIKGIRNKGFEPIILKKHENISENVALKLEEFYIKKFGKLIDQTGCLSNILDGGINPPNAKGRKASKETIDKLSKSKLGVLNPMFGKKYDEIEKLRFSKPGEKHPLFGSKFQWFNDGVNNIRLKLEDPIPIGFKRGLIKDNSKNFNIKDHIPKNKKAFDIGAYMKGRTMSDESRLRMSKSKQNVAKSEEHKANIRIAVRKAKAK